MATQPGLAGTSSKRTMNSSEPPGSGELIELPVAEFISGS
jgi:hypothetical protein